MSDASSDDLDNLFRRAAEKYPLRTDSSDWEKVARELDKEDGTRTAFPQYFQIEKKKRGWYLLLVLLLPIAAIGYHFWNHQFSPTLSAPNKTLQSGTQNNRSEDVVRNTNPSAEDKKSTLLNKKSAGTRMVIEGADATFPSANKRLGINLDKSPKSGNSEIIGRTTASKSSHPGKAPKYYQSNFEIGTHDTKVEKNGFEPGNNEKMPDAKGKDKETGSQWRLITNFQIAPLFENKSSELDLNNIKINKSAPDIINSNQLNNTIAKNKKKESKNRNYLPLYAGLVIAPDMSLVKFQSPSGPGYTVGALFGYRISHNLAFETGIYLDDKKYYTEGEYFSSKKVQFLNYVNLLNVSGSCKMLEVPLNLRYNVFSRNKNTWFVSGGVSSYFMFKEGYSYKYIYNGSEGEKYYSYSNPSQYWFSILNFSAGYEHNISKIGSLRLEPYLRIPLTGMGTGNLPIISAGINIGIIHPFK